MNFLGLIAAAAANMALGFLWYSPLMFAKPWMKEMGYTEKSIKAEQKKMGPMYSLSLVAALVTAFVLSQLLSFTLTSSLKDALSLGFMLWLGFIAPVQFTDVLFGGKSWKLYAINTGYQLASTLAMATLLFLLG